MDACVGLRRERVSLPVGALAVLSDGSRAAFGQGHKHAQRFEHAFLATEMLPKIFVQEHRLLEVAAQRSELVRADGAGEVHLGHFRERRLGGFSLGRFVVAHSFFFRRDWLVVR
jgi:hypothetical protein